MSNILLIGKTNAGKSSLFNALVGRRISVVDDTENLTNDVVKFCGNSFTIMDSPGVQSTSELQTLVEKSGRVDLVCIVVDVQDYSPQFCKRMINFFKDRECIVVVNKIDRNPGFTCELGLVKVFYVSATYGNGIDKLRKALQISEKHSNSNTWTIFGRSNVGKSTLGNALVGRNRFTVMDAIGTTREINRESLPGSDADIIDTPGYRKNKHIDTLSKASQYRLDNYIYSSRNDCFAIMVIDASAGITSVDKHIIDKIMDQFIVILVLNKADLVSKEVIHELSSELNRLYGDMICVPVSACNKTGLRQLRLSMSHVENIPNICTSTSSLNKWLRNIAKVSYIKYITRADLRRFLLFAKKPVPSSTVRYLESSLCKNFGLNGMRLQLEVVLS